MLLPILAMLVAAEPLVSKPVSLALPGLNGVNLAPGEMQLHAETLAQKLIAHGLSVMTARDLETALGIERQKQLLGCSEDNQCLIELTGALGVDAVIIGDLGRLEGHYVLNLKALSPSTGKPLGIYNSRGKPDDIDRMLENGARTLLKSLAFSLHREDLAGMDFTLLPDPALVVKPAAPPPPDHRAWALLPAGMAVGAFATGAVMQMVAGQKYDALKAGGLSESEARSLRDSGRGIETGANAVMIGGGVALGAALIVYLVGAPAPVTPSVAVTPQGSYLGVSGVFP
ncbi:MAG: hypothetical protein QM817_06305 [Archangium sp.]